MAKYIRSDLALENREKICGGNSFLSRKESIDDIIDISEISSANGEKYVTIYADGLWRLDSQMRDTASTVIASELRRVIPTKVGKKIDKNFSVLVIGIGNEELTADAIGPKTVKELLITRHLKSEEPKMFFSLPYCSVSAISPGVLGQTGIETAVIIKGIVEQTKPDVVIAIDALAARAEKRLANTVQITTCGITPGAGIENSRCEISQKSIGVPVISIGIPTVIGSSVLVLDALEKAQLKSKSAVSELLRTREDRESEEFFVMPRDGDVITRDLSELLAEALEKTFSVF